MSGTLHRLARTWAAPILALPLLALFVVLFAVPLFEILRVSFSAKEGGLSGFEWLASSPVVVVIFLRTFELAFWVTLLCLAIGYPVAVHIARQPERRRGVLLALVLLPFWTSVLVRTYTWTIVLGREGLLNASLIWLGLADGPQRFLFTPFAVQLGMVHILLPVAILTLVGVMTELDAGLVRAARVMGASPLRAFLGVTLPNISAGLTGAFVFAAIMSFDDVGLALFITSSRSPTLPVAIFTYLDQTYDPLVVAVSSFMIIISTAVVLILDRTVGISRVLMNVTAR